MIYFSTMLYALGKELGPQNALEEFARQLAEPDQESLPVVRTLALLRQLDDVQLLIEPGATCIAKSRSRAFHEALLSGADVWVSCDDDVEADLLTLETMLRAVGWVAPSLSFRPLRPTYTERANIVFVPCLLRGTRTVNISVALDPPRREIEGGGSVVSVLAGGFGLVASTRAALNRLNESWRQLRWTDDDGRTKRPLFLERFSAGRWWGEDLSFCHRAAVAGVPLEALLEGCSAHAGQALILAQVYAHKLLECPPGMGEASFRD